jgi:rubredoxin
MGRKKEFVASKSFTLGLQELMYMEKKCNEQGIKASKFLNRLLRRAMLTDLEKENLRRKPVGRCHTCEDFRGYDLVDDEWLCEVCKLEKTEYINAIVK